MADSLHKRVVGQDEAINVIVRAIRRSRAGLKNPNRPIGSFMFLGPTGVGKTEVARSVAEFLFDDSESMIRIDMSEYMEKYAVSRLVGAPPGYVGYEEGGQLTEAVRRRPYSVVLLDEIEKAHPDVFNLLLQVLDDGRLTDSQGRQVDFKNCVIIMTSNVGATGMQTTTDIGFRTSKTSDEDEGAAYERMKNKVLEEVKHTFRPEFVNRLDEIVVFHQLTRAQIEQIVGLELEKVMREVKAQDMSLEVTEEAKALLAKKGWDPQYGARPLRRAIQREVEDELAEEMLRGTFAAGDRILGEVDPDNPEKLRFSKIPASSRRRSANRSMRPRNMKGALIGALFAITGCGGGSGPPAPAPTSPPPPPSGAKFDSIVKQNYGDQWGVELGIYRNGAPIYVHGYGLRDRGTPETFYASNVWGISQPDVVLNMNRGAFATDPDTVFDLASVSKEFTAAAILLLQQDGKLAVSDPVSKYFPNLPSAGSMTLLNLLQHSSGFVDYNNFQSNPDFTPAYQSFMSSGQTNYQPIVDELATFPLLFTPGTQYRYSNTNYLLLGMIVAHVSGETLGAFLQQRVFRPLGMTRTQQGYPSGTDLALGYADWGNGAQRIYQWNLMWLAGPGGLTSTVGDLEKWDEAVRAPGIFTSASLKQMFTPGPFPQSYGTYADGWLVRLAQRPRIHLA